MNKTLEKPRIKTPRVAPLEGASTYAPAGAYVSMHCGGHDADERRFIVFRTTSDNILLTTECTEDTEQNHNSLCSLCPLWLIILVWLILIKCIEFFILVILSFADDYIYISSMNQGCCKRRGNNGLS
jgi:hypothetical protein